MSYDLNLNIPDNSPQAYNIEAMAAIEHISREEAALRLLAQAKNLQQPASQNARRIIGALSDPKDAALLDAALELAMLDREKRNTPHA